VTKNRSNLYQKTKDVSSNHALTASHSKPLQLLLSNVNPTNLGINTLNLFYLADKAFKETTMLPNICQVNNLKEIFQLCPH
jgi:hypothetical protein